MKKNQLDFNAPLLSVRRFSPTLATSDGVNRKSPPNRQQSLPVQKSDWELDEVTRPGEVPFLWEHIPGRPKNESGIQLQQIEEPSNSSRIPPRRVLAAIKHVSAEKSNDQNVCKSQTKAYPSNDYTKILDSMTEGLNGKGDSDVESEDDAYSDALDTLSPAESCSLNYSVSGLSGYDEPDVKPSGTFSADPQTRDFMMSRFLPAAKAMVLETPQYVSRKQPVVIERPRHVKKVVSGELRPLFEQQGSKTISHRTQCIKDVKGADKDDCKDPGKRIGKVFGLFPRLCMKNSLCLLNPVPGLKSRTQTPTPKSSSREVSRLARTSYSGPLTQPFDKNARNAVHKKQLHPGVRSQELHQVDYKMIGESKKFSYSGDLYTTDGLSPCRRFKAGGISPYRNETPQSPFRDGARFLGIPKEVENVKAGKLGSFRKGCIQDVHSGQIFKHGSGSVHPAVEKTLYIDSVKRVEIQVLKSGSSEAERCMNSSSKNFKTLKESRRKETYTAKSSIQDKKCLDVLEQGNASKPKESGSLDDDIPSLASILNFKGQGLNLDPGFDQDICTSKSPIQDIKGLHLLEGGSTPKPKAFGLLDTEPSSLTSMSTLKEREREEVLKLESVIDQEFRSLECTKVQLNGNSEKNNEHSMKPDDHGNPNVGYLQSPLNLPLPKSPSESWLWRTLPSISVQNPLVQHNNSSHFHLKKQDKKTSISGTKWETIVKTSNLHHDHIRYSEELIPRVPEHSEN